MRPTIDTSLMSSLGQLRLALAETEHQYVQGGGVTIGDLLRPLGAQASALAATLLALPFLSPVSLGALTAPASLLIALLGWRILGPGESTPLPVRLLAMPVPRALHRATDRVLHRVHGWMQRFSRPRHGSLVAGRRGRIICGAGVIAGATLLAVPVPLLPLTNTFPAVGILCFGLGWAERDGLLTVLGGFALLLSTALFAGIGTALFLAGSEVLLHLPWIGS